jgi:transposase
VSDLRVAAAIHLGSDEKAELQKLLRRRTTPVRVTERCRIVMLAGEGLQDLEIAAQLSVAPRTAARWRGRFLAEGVAGLLKDAQRPGRPTTITDETVAAVVTKTTQSKPDGATHWSRSTMARAAGISDSSVGRIWRAHGLKPHRIDTFKISNDPHFAEKLEDIVGLYLNPPEHALVLSVDEKSQIQALDRTQPGLPMKKGRGQTMPRLQAQRHHHAVCRAQHRHRRGLRPLPATASPSGMAEVPSPDRQNRRGRKASPHHLRQLRHPQASNCRPLDGEAQTLPRALHAHLGLMAEHGRALLPRPDREQHPTRRLPGPRTTHHCHRRLYGPP